MRMLGRGRVAMWTKEKISTLTTLEVRQLRVNAERLLESEVAALCDEVLGARPRGHAVARKRKPKGAPARLVSRV